jgi:Polyketide cyclase / dehydrase and lipid transport
MNSNSTIIHHSIYINKPKSEVWDFTQDYDNRNRWDSSVLEAKVLQTLPHRIVKLKMKSNTEMTFIYKLDDRPNKTTLAATEIQSPIIEAAGGSWNYVEQNKGTLWSQTNTIIFKKKFLSFLRLPFYKFVFTQLTKQAMRKAKKLIEKI